MRTYSQPERAMLLLYALLGTPLRESLYRRLQRAFQALGPGDDDLNEELSESHLARLGCTAEEAGEILGRLGQDQLLDRFLWKLDRLGIQVITKLSPEYPERLREKLGDYAPLVLFCAGDLTLFQKPCISLVGSRRLRRPGQNFAQAAGRAMVRQGYVYCSGGANGADSLGFSGAMEQGGSAVLFLADSLLTHKDEPRYRRALESGRLLLVSEQGADMAFTTPRALSRNRLIHALPVMTLVAQSAYGSGGTWNGTLENLKNQWSPVYMFSGEPKDPGTVGLIERGAAPVTMEELSALSELLPEQTTLY